MKTTSDRQLGVYRAEDGRFETRLASTLAETERLLEEAAAEGVPSEDALRAMRRESGRTVRMTARQRREVRRMLEDGEAYTRAEAVAWVLQFGEEG